MASSGIPLFTVFLSHAGEDKATIAIPLREKLNALGISAFVDEVDITPGFDAQQVMISAMNTAKVAVVVLSPEFVARKWPMKELMCFLSRCENSNEDYPGPIIVPFFYRLSISDLYQEPRLDRTDRNGQNLYQASRFFERMDAGEPEASIPTIMTALRKLHSIMGVRNDLDASNDSSYQMSLRRELLLKIVCAAVVRSMRKNDMPTSSNLREAQSESDSFRTHYDITHTTAELVFNFFENEETGFSNSLESRVLQAVIDDSPEAKKVISICGMAGVGKTSLLRGISCLKQVKRCFKDGLYHVSLGIDVTELDLIEALSTAVQRSGGTITADKMRAENNLQKAILQFRSWFTERQFILFFDDVWKTQEISENTVHDFLNLHECGRDSKVLFTTRNMQLASRASTSFTLDPREASSHESRAILIRYAGLEPEPLQIADNRVVDEILERCQGLPLFLAIAGRSVKSLSFRRGYEGCAAYHAYAVYVRVRVRPLLYSCLDSYRALAQRLNISLDLLEERRNRLGINVRLPFSEMYRRLSVLLRQARVPMAMLRRLWHLENKEHAAAVAMEFAHVGLVDIDLKTSPSEEDMLLRLHDSVYEFTVEEVRERGEEKIVHEMLLREYGRDTEEKLGQRMWWSRRLQHDGYIHWQLCRHLMCAGRQDELVSLLLRPEWVSRVISIRQVADVERDFVLGISVLKRSHELFGRDAGSSNGSSLSDKTQTLQSLWLVLQALRLSCFFVEGNPREIWFHMHGRLLGHSKLFPRIRTYVSWIEKKSPKPRLLSISPFLRAPGDPGATASREDDSINSSIVMEESSSIRCMAIMKKGDRLACGCEDGTIDILNLRGDKKIERAWKAHGDGVLALAIARDEKRLVSTSLDKTAKVWHLERRFLILTFGQHTQRVTCVAMIGNSRRAVSASADGTAQVWNTETGNVWSQFGDHEGCVRCVTVLPNRELLATAGEDRTMRLWDASTGAQIAKPFLMPDRVTSITVTRDERLIVTGSEDGSLRVWDIATLTQVGEAFVGHTQPINSLDVNHDGSRIFSCSDDDTIRVWDARSGVEICEPLLGHTSSVNCVSFLPGDAIVSCSDDGTVRLWNLPRDILRKEDRHEHAVTCVTFTPDGTNVVSGSEDATIRIWNTTGNSVACLQGHRSDVTGVAVKPGGKHLVSVSLDDTLRVWDMESRMCLRTITCNTGLIHTVAILPSGDRAVTGSQDSRVRIWDLSAATDGGHVLLEGHSAPVRRVFLSQDSERIISVAGDEIFVWEISVSLAVLKVFKDSAWKLGKTEIFNTVHEEFDDVPISVSAGRDSVSCSEICYGDGGPVLGTLDYEVRDWDYNGSLCVGLDNGCVAIMKVEL